MASMRRSELNQVGSLIEAIGKRLGYSTKKQEKNYLWQENGRPLRILYPGFGADGTCLI